MSINGERVNKLWCVPAAAGRRNVGPGTRGADGRVPHELRAEGPSKRSMCCTSIYGKLRTGQPSRPPALGTGAPGREKGLRGPGALLGGQACSAHACRTRQAVRFGGVQPLACPSHTDMGVANAAQSQ